MATSDNDTDGDLIKEHNSESDLGGGRYLVAM